MDMTAKKDVVWLFADSPGLPLAAQFLSCENEKSKQGAEYPVITLESAGTKFKVSSWKTDSSACAVKWGKKSEDWAGKNVSLSLDKKERFVLKPSEEELAK